MSEAHSNVLRERLLFEGSTLILERALTISKILEEAARQVKELSVSDVFTVDQQR